MSYNDPTIAQCDEPRRPPAEQLDRAIDNMHDIVRALNTLRADIQGDDTAEKTSPGAEVRPTPVLGRLLNDGPIRLDTVRNECLDTIQNLRDILL
jgi:hypothetical protein